MGFNTKAQAKAVAQPHQYVKKNKNGTWRVVNRKAAGKIVSKQNFGAKKRSKGTKKKYSFYRGKGNCGHGGYIGGNGWCKARFRKSGPYIIRRKAWYQKGTSYQRGRKLTGRQQRIDSELYDVRKRRSQRS
jgi:hypothetical protein